MTATWWPSSGAPGTAPRHDPERTEAHWTHGGGDRLLCLGGTGDPLVRLRLNHPEKRS